jgi:hypothetical protein
MHKLHYTDTQFLITQSLYKMKKLGLFFTLTLLCLLNFAQTGNLKGKVKHLNATPFSAAVVTLWEGKMLKYETLTNEEGFFQIEEIAIGAYRLNVASSLSDSSSMNVVIKENKTTEQDFTLKTNQDKLAEINAKAAKEVAIAKVEKPGKGDYEKEVALKEKSASKKASSTAKGGTFSSPKPSAPAPTMTFSEFSKSKIKTAETYSAPMKLETTSSIKMTEEVDKSGGGEGYAEDAEEAGFVGGDDGVSFEGDVAEMSSKAILEDKKEVPTTPVAKAGTLTAGEVSDFSKWNLWSNVAEKDLETWSTAWQILPKNRYTVQLSNEKDYPVVGANVYLTTKKGVKMWAAKTDNTGKAELWENIFVNDSLKERNPHISIEYKGKNYDVKKAKKFQEGINFVKITTPCAEKQVVDIAFIVDATGSMDDEINYLKTELYDVIAKVKDTLKTADLQLASVFYRDNGDSYLTKETELSADISKTVNFIKANGAGGGGDTPEAVEEALQVSLRNLKWRENATSKIAFLILDAPPHSDYVTMVKIKQLMKEAAAKGVRLVPIVCSGADKGTEYLMRTFALATNGTYLFLTNHSGVGGGHISPTTDKFEVVLFNNLLRNTIVNFTQIQKCEQSQILAKQDTGKVNETVNVQVQDSAQNTRIEKQPLTWKYYPNPTTGIIKVEVNGQMNELFVADITGKVLQRYERTAESLITVDISEFPNGIYLLRYEYEADKWMSGKVILAH